MIKTVTARFVTRHGDVFWGPVTVDGDQHVPTHAKLEQYVGTFAYAHGSDDDMTYTESKPEYPWT